MNGAVVEIRDYLRMLRRGWPAILVIAALFVGLAGAYLSVAPRTYDASTTLLVSPNRPDSVEQLQAGNTFVSYQVATYAQIIDSPTVLAPVASKLSPNFSTSEITGMVTASVRPETTLIDITATGSDPAVVAAVANAAGESAVATIPNLQTGVRGVELIRVDQIRRAAPADRATSPNAKRILAAGLLVGVFVGLAGTVAFQTLDTRIRRLYDLAQLCDVPVLAVLPKLGKAGRRGLVVREDPGGDIGDSFRALRTNLRTVEPKERRSFVVAPVAESKNGGVITANLAWTLAQTGRHVLLLDLDLRRSAIGDQLRLGRGPGATDVLLGQVDLKSVTHVIDQDRLHAVLSGTEVPNPTELLSSSALGKLIDWAESQYDYVVLSAPAVLEQTDTAEISAAAGGVLLTVASGRTKAQELTTALTTLGNVRVTPLGLVLTRATAATFEHNRRSKFRLPKRRLRPLHRIEWETVPEETTKPAGRP